MYDLAADEVENIAEAFLDAADAGEEQYEYLKDDAEALKDVAIRYSRLQKAVLDLSENYDEYQNVRKTGLAAITLREDDELIEVKITDDEKDVFIVTKYGQCIRFDEKDVRPTGRTSMGVRGINLEDNDEVVGMQLDVQGQYLLIASEKGMGKRTDIEEFKVQNRGGKGVKCYNITEKTGDVVGVKSVNEDNEIMIINTDGIIIRMECAGISILGRVTSGVKLINLHENSKVASIAKVRGTRVENEDLNIEINEKE